MPSDRALLNEHRKGATYSDLAARYGLNPDGVRGRISRAVRKELEPQRYQFTGVEPPQYSGQPVFDGQLRLDADELMIAGDIHVPSTNYPLLSSMVALAEKHMKPPRRLLICGDLSNGDQDTSHAPLAPTISRQSELRQLERLMDWLLLTFDHIYLTPGNHLRHRLMNALKADIGADQVVRLFVPPEHLRRVTFSWYDEVHVTSAGERYVVLHQYQYRQVKLSIANDMAQKYQSNTIVFHQHHTAIGRDKYERYTIVDCGGLHDQRMMAYVNLVPSTLPRMNNGFVFLRGGTAHLLTNYRTFTDWNLWGVKPPWDAAKPKQLAQPAPEPPPPTPPTSRARDVVPPHPLELLPHDKPRPRKRKTA